MNERDETIHRTWVQLLVEYGQKEAASIAIDIEMRLIQDGYRSGEVNVQFHVATTIYPYVKNNKHLQEIFEETLGAVLIGRSLEFDVYNDFENEWYKHSVIAEQLVFAYFVQLITVEEGWKDTIRALIASSKGVNNQGATSVHMFEKYKKDIISYDGLKFASHTEVRIAQEFQQRKILFFPLAVGVRADTGRQYDDHREVDFLICVSGIWGILEISGPSHNLRYAQDTAKDRWFKKSGILCIEHRKAEDCDNPKKVVDEFLSVLNQYKK